MVILQGANLLLRFVLELGALASLGYWGAHLGNGGAAKLLGGIGLPLLAAVVWGAFVAPQAAVSVPVWLHVLLEILVLGGAGAALFAAGLVRPGVLYSGLLLLNWFLLALWKQ